MAKKPLKQTRLAVYAIAHPVRWASVSALIILAWCRIIGVAWWIYAPLYPAMFVLTWSSWREGGWLRRREERRFPPVKRDQGDVASQPPPA